MRARYGRVLALAGPMILSNLTVPLVGIVDTAVTGRLPGPVPMAAVAVGASIFTSVFWSFGFLRMGTTGFVAQAHGSGDSRALSLALGRSLWVAVLLGMLLVLLRDPLAAVALYLMNADAAVTAEARQYVAIRMWSAPATFVNYCVLGALIGLQRTTWALATQMLLNLSNVVLDILFVLGMAVKGVALASVISDYLACGLGLWLLRAHVAPLLRGGGDVYRQLLRRSAVRALFSVNADLFLRTFLLTAGFFFFTAQGAQMGTPVLAANTVLMQLLVMQAYGLDGFAHAAEALAGSAYGAGNARQFRQAVRDSAVLAVVTALLIALVYLILGELFVRAMTDIADVRARASAFLPWLVLTPLVAVASYQLDGIFIGATQTRAMRNSVALSLLLYVAVALVAVRVGGNHALWASLMLFFVLRAILLYRHYPRLVARLRAGSG